MRPTRAAPLRTDRLGEVAGRHLRRATSGEDTTVAQDRGRRCLLSEEEFPTRLRGNCCLKFGSKELWTWGWEFVL